MDYFDTHILTLIFLMIAIGSFGGLLNFLHNFDTLEDDGKNRSARNKYMLLGVGASLLVPIFLKMIGSDLIKNTSEYANTNYLIFSGFCLVAAIFSRRFISTIGDRVLEAAKNAQEISNENKKQLESNKVEISTAQERIEDVKVAVNLKSIGVGLSKADGDDTMTLLLDLVNSFVEKTSVPDYAVRLKLKAEIGRTMGQLIVRFNLPKEELLTQNPKEGMYLALAYSVELKPDIQGLSILNKLSELSSQLYTKYVILIAYRTLASSGHINKDQAKVISKLVEKFKDKADLPLIRNIDDTLNVLSFIDPTIKRY